MGDHSELRQFVDELEELSKKHNVAVDGCGCCGSPYVLRKSGKFMRYGQVAEDTDYPVIKIKPVFEGG